MKAESIRAIAEKGVVAIRNEAEARGVEVPDVVILIHTDAEIVSDEDTDTAVYMECESDAGSIMLNLQRAMFGALSGGQMPDPE